MYKINDVLVYNQTIVGLRLLTQKDNRFIDLDIDRLGKIENLRQRLEGTQVVNLEEKDGLLMSRHEANGNMQPVPSVPEDVEHDKLIKKLFLTSHTIEECEKAVRFCVDKICKYKRIGVTIQEVYTKGKESYMQSDDSIRYRFGAKIKTQHKFEWNDDHEYCERQYDAFGVIDNDKNFDEWVDYAKQVAEDVAKHFGLYISVDLEGIKYDITLDVTAYSLSFKDKVHRHIR